MGQPVGQVHMEQKVVKKPLTQHSTTRTAGSVTFPLPCPPFLEESTASGKVTVNPGNLRKQKLKLVWEGSIEFVSAMGLTYKIYLLRDPQCKFSRGHPVS